MKVQYKINEVRPKIFHVAFKDQYDMCMTFWRAQETYESPNPKFRNNSFTLVEFMRWYANTYGKGAFTYPNDWSGFNVPSEIVEFVASGGYDEATNEYDRVMEDIYYKCHDTAINKYGYGNTVAPRFYLIGTLEGASKTIQHEVAHGFWYTTPAYKKEMLALVKKMKPSLKKKLCKELAKIGYTKQVFDDECHAYMSTGLSDKFGITLKGEDKQFIEVFKRYYNAD